MYKIMYLSERFWKFSQLSLILRCNSYWVSDLSLGTLLNFLSGPKKEFIYVLLMILRYTSKQAKIILKRVLELK